VACHNSSAYLDEAVNSVLGQTLGDLEVILIDDCSTDNTLEIAARYQAQDDRVSVISLPVNSGPATARNAGIRAARGEWLGILDSDDVAMPTRFEEQLRLARSDKGLVMLGSSSISINKHGHLLKEHKYPTDHQELVKRLYSLRAFLPHSSVVYRTAIVERLGSFNLKYKGSEDYDLWLRLSEVGKIGSINKPLVKIRKHDQNISNSEGGLLQPRYGSAASICHFLRIHGCLDPSTNSDEPTWQEFFTWVDRRLMEEGVFARHEAWADARAGYFSTANRLAGALRFGIRLLQSGHASALVWEKYFGSSLPQRLAREWMVATI
jgi:glycosyltransferase involved in cell wall biosynthesis